MSCFDIKAIKEEIAQIKASMGALDDLLVEEGREPTQEEQQQLDGWVAQIGNDGSDGEPKTALLEKLERAEKFQKARNVSLGNILMQSGETPKPDATTGPVDVSRIVVPAQCRSGKNLIAFQGENAEQRAYIAGQHLLATIFQNDRAREWCESNGVPIIKQVMKENDNAKGGFLVADEMARSIIILREEYGVFRREANNVPMGSEVVDWPKHSSGLTVYFPGEGNTITASDAAVDNVKLVAKKMATLTRYSSEVGADAVIALADYITNEIAYAFANKEDECGFNGDGTSTYGGMTGVLNAMNAGSIYTAATGNTAFSTLDLADFEGVVGKLPQYAHGNAKWYISRAGYWNSAANLANAGSGNTTETVAGGPSQTTFLGYPVVYSQVLNSTLTAQTSTNIACFGDLRASAMLGNRSGISVMGSEHRYFESDEVAIRGLERVDVNVHEKGTATAAGAMIVLATPAS